MLMLSRPSHEFSPHVLSEHTGFDKWFSKSIMKIFSYVSVRKEFPKIISKSCSGVKICDSMENSVKNIYFKRI